MRNNEIAPINNINQKTLGENKTVNIYNEWKIKE